MFREDNVSKDFYAKMEKSQKAQRKSQKRVLQSSEDTDKNRGSLWKNSHTKYIFPSLGYSQDIFFSVN